MQESILIERLQKLIPLEHAAEWDNVGLLLNPRIDPDIQRILLTIDLSPEVAAEAVEKEIDLILSYHPIFFAPIQHLNARDPRDKIILDLSSEGVAVYSPHTALDALPGGVNDWLAGAFDTQKTSVLHPRSEHPEIGLGRLLTLKRPTALENLARQIKQHLGLNHIRLARAPESPERCSTIALCAGSGASVLADAKADLYLTGEMKHHDILAATQNGHHVLLSEHSNSERGFLPHLCEMLGSCLEGKVAVDIAASDKSPLALL